MGSVNKHVIFLNPNLNNYKEILRTFCNQMNCSIKNKMTRPEKIALIWGRYGTRTKKRAPGTAMIKEKQQHARGTGMPRFHTYPRISSKPCSAVLNHISGYGVIKEVSLSVPVNFQ